MKTWRERIAEARERGSFTYEDISLAAGYRTCLIGEAVAILGGTYASNESKFRVSIPGFYGNELCGEDSSIATGGAFQRVVAEHDITRAEQLLEAVEDRLLQLKRGEK